MNNRLAIAILVFLVSQTLVAQHGHLWTTQEFKRNVQYEGYVVDLDGDTIRGFIQFADRIEIQEEVKFFLEKSNKKTDTTYRPADLLWYHFLDKTYQCINYSGGTSTKLIKGSLLLEEGCISKLVWFRDAPNRASLRRELNETLTEYGDRLYPSNEFYYHNTQRRHVTLDYFLLDFIGRMSTFIREDRELFEKVKFRDKGYGPNDIPEIFQEYNENCK